MAAVLTPELTDLQSRALDLRDKQHLGWAEMGKVMGIPRGSARGHYQRAVRKIQTFSGTPDESVMERQFAEFLTGVKSVTSDVLLEMLEMGLLKALWRLANDPGVLARLNGKDLASTARNLNEMRQLLRGEPTKIISMEDRRGMAELSKAIFAEAKRRGVDFTDFTLPAEQYSVDEPGVALKGPAK